MFWEFFGAGIGWALGALVVIVLVVVAVLVLLGLLVWGFDTVRARVDADELGKQGKGNQVSVQVQPAKPKDSLNGLAAIEADLLDEPERTVVAVVTYRVAKIVDDLKKDERYPVLSVASIEPIRGELEEKAFSLREAAHKARTGEQLELDFDAPDGEGGES